jgi:hypothetical protein
MAKLGHCKSGWKGNKKKGRDEITKGGWQIATHYDTTILGYRIESHL